MKYQEALQGLLLDDPIRMKALSAIQSLKLNDGWIGAGFVRDVVWDHLHGYKRRPISGDVDVVWFDSERLSTENALLYWPETATAVAVRIGETNFLEIIVPYGLDDLFELRLRPTPSFESEKLNIFRQRVAEKGWMERYPTLQFIISE